MQAGELKLLATRISSGLLAAALVAFLAVTAQAGGKPAFPSPQAAFEAGLNAYKAGKYEAAIPALEAAAGGSETTRFFAQFYLARIYSDNSGTEVDHAKAYYLFQKLADDNADADPDEGHRAPFVAKALTALAVYLRAGVPEAGVEPDPDRAVEYLQNAATSFGDQEAQFELAKIYLSGNGDAEDIKRGMHYLSVLTEEGYPSAQALLADLMWRGRYVRKNEQRALALITMAVENAPAHDRIWIEDIYQNVYCGTTQGTREQADTLISVWKKMFARPASSGEHMGLGVRGAEPQRTCRNGEVVEIRRSTAPAVAADPGNAMARPAAPANGRSVVLQGSTTGFGLREAGATTK